MGSDEVVNPNTMNQDNHKNPLVTVLMPTYNSERYINEAIDSILHQSYTNFELLIIDDCSSDSTREIIRQYSDPRIRTIFHQKRVGLAQSLNIGVRTALGGFIARMDADDISHPDRLEEQVRFLEGNRQCGVISGFIRLIDKNGIPCGIWEADQKGNTSNRIDSLLPWENCIAHPTILIRKEILLQYPYDEGVKGAEDYELWLRLRYFGVIIDKLPKTLLDYRIHTDSVTSSLNIRDGAFYKVFKARNTFLLKSLSAPSCSILPFRVMIAQLNDLYIFFREHVQSIVPHLFYPKNLK